MILSQKTIIILQYSQCALIVLNANSLVRLAKRTVNFLKLKPGLKDGYVCALNVNNIAKVPLPPIDLEIKEVTDADDEEIGALAKFDFHGHSPTEILQYLADGQQCYIAKHKGQVVSCYWILGRTFWEYRHFEMAKNEEYQTGVFTLTEFRGKGIFPYLARETWQMQARTHPDLRVLVIIEVNNKTSLRSHRKLGFTVVGRVGFVELLGLRFHYLLGRDAFPKTTPRFFFERL